LSTASVISTSGTDDTPFRAMVILPRFDGHL
jgi:hypothetical protein